MSEDTLDLDKFNPTVAELTKLATSAKEIVVTDFSDKSQLKLSKTKRIELRDARITVEKTGKSLREKAIAFQKAVIVKEKDLIAIIEPEEDRLKGFEEEADKLALIEERKASLPLRHSRLKSIGDDVPISDDEICAMDEDAFNAYYNTRLGTYNEKVAEELAEKKRVAEVEETERKRKIEIAEAEEKARIEEREKIEREEKERKEQEAKALIEKREAEEKAIKENADRIEREAKERADKVERDAKEKAEKAERERQEVIDNEREQKERIAKEESDKAIREAEEKATLLKAEKYQKFLTIHGVTEATSKDFEERRVGNTVQLWKRVDTFVVE